MKKSTLLLVLVFLLTLGTVTAQRKITGTVSSAQDNKPAAGVTVSVKGTTIGTFADENGRYEIMVPEKYKTLVFAFVGLKTLEVAIGASNEINVSMQPDVL